MLEGQGAVPQSTLRDLLYLDEERVESYISQIAGGLITEQSGEDGRDQLSHIGVSKVFLASRNEKVTFTSFERRVPKHAILSLLEALLTEKSLVSDGLEPSQHRGILHLKPATVNFENWGLLTSLAEAGQGIADLAAKVTLSQCRTQMVDFESRLRRLVAEISKINKVMSHRGKKQGASGKDGIQEIKAEYEKQLTEFKKTLPTLNPLWRIVTDAYLEDVRSVVEICFEQRFQVRAYLRLQDGGERCFVGALDEKSVVGGDMGTLVFNYGSNPSREIEILAMASDPRPRENRPRFSELTTKFGALGDNLRDEPFDALQVSIREFGAVFLQMAEALRRPVTSDHVVIIPLAIWSQVTK